MNSPHSTDENIADAESWVSVYFSNPDDPGSQNLRGGPDMYLAEAIRRARLSVDIAAYQFNLWSLRDALINAYRRGVTVRMVIESENIDEEEVQQLIEAGIPILGDRREGLMHNKFVVIDRNEVWTGSMNFTINGAFRNDNNLIRIRSIQLAENYTTEFEEMFNDDRFGQGSPSNTPYPLINIDDDTWIETYFSPDDGTLAHLLSMITAAQKSILFLAYSFTSDDLAEAIIACASKGVRVSGVLERSQYSSNTGSEFDNFLGFGLDILLDTNVNKMHHKVIIIDNQIVITGSYNFSASAESHNDENTLIIHDPETAALFLFEFNRILLKTKQ